MAAAIFIGWVAGTIFVYYHAKSKSMEPLNYVLISIFLSPLVGILALELKASENTKKAEAAKEEAKKNSVGTANFIEPLNTICNLYEHELIDENEFQAKKRELINQLASQKLQEKPEEFLMRLISFKEKGYLTGDDIALIKKLIF